MHSEFNVAGFESASRTLGGKTKDFGVFTKKAIAQGVAFVPGAPFYAGEPDESIFRLSFATADLVRIEEGMGRLGNAI